MPTRKQRSRRAKTFRHDYALVKYDEEGNEIEVTSTELRSKPADGAKDPARGSGRSGTKPVSRRGAPQPASWERALKRGGLTGIGLAVLLTFVLHGPPFLALIYGVAFIPMTYYADRFTYRLYERRQGKAAVQAPPRGRKR
jgi:hypothetical protein